MAQSGAAGGAVEVFAGEGLGDHADHGRAIVAQPDQGGPERKTGNEGAGAVDGVEHPDELGVRAVLAIFLADDAMVGKAGGDLAPDGGLGALVGFGDGVEDPAGLRALVDQAVIGPEQRQDDLGGRLRQVQAECFKV